DLALGSASSAPTTGRAIVTIRPRASAAHQAEGFLCPFDSQHLSMFSSPAVLQDQELMFSRAEQSVGLALLRLYSWRRIGVGRHWLTGGARTSDSFVLKNRTDWLRCLA